MKISFRKLLKIKTLTTSGFFVVNGFTFEKKNNALLKSLTYPPTIDLLLREELKSRAKKVICVNKIFLPPFLTSGPFSFSWPDILVFATE